MSTPAQVTDAHVRLAIMAHGYAISGRSSREAARLIADSEARTVAEKLRDYLSERDKLRVELANQKVQNNHNWQFQEISEEALKRAERAEAELATLRQELDDINKLSVRE